MHLLIPRPWIQDVELFSAGVIIATWRGETREANIRHVSGQGRCLVHTGADGVAIQCFQVKTLEVAIFSLVIDCLGHT